jgi:hypothetical protein
LIVFSDIGRRRLISLGNTKHPVPVSGWRESQRKAGYEAPFVAIDSSEELAHPCRVDDAREMPTLRRRQGSAQVGSRIPACAGSCYRISKNLTAGLKASVCSIERSTRLDASNNL